jgi:hypothetical protein
VCAPAFRTVQDATGACTWYFDQGDGNNAIQLPQTSTSTTTSTDYQAQVQQPINADGSSVFSAKRRTIPIKYKVQKQTVTTTTTTATVYPGVLDSENGLSYPAKGAYGALVWSPPSGSGLTVSDLTSLVAHYTWSAGADHGGSMRWEINTPDGNIQVYFGDPDSYEASQLGHSPMYDTLANVLAATVPSGITIGNERVNWLNLTVDAGWGGPQKVTPQDVTIGTKLGTSTYTPGSAPGSTSTSSVAGPACPPPVTRRGCTSTRPAETLPHRRSTRTSLTPRVTSVASTGWLTGCTCTTSPSATSQTRVQPTT